MIQIRQLGTIIAGMVLMTVFPCVYGQSRADLDKPFNYLIIPIAITDEDK